MEQKEKNEIRIAGPEEAEELRAKHGLGIVGLLMRMSRIQVPIDREIPGEDETDVQ